MTADPDTNARQAAEVRALRGLRAGDTAQEVAAATGLTVAQVEQLGRDFPSTPSGASATTRATLHILAQPGDDPLGRLLTQAAKHRSKRIGALGLKIGADVDRLRALLAADAEKDAERRAAEKLKQEALAEVARLEAQLRDAKAKLKGPVVAKPRLTAASRPAPAGVRACVDCGGEVVRQPGQMGAPPKRCQDCR